MSGRVNEQIYWQITTMKTETWGHVLLMYEPRPGPCQARIQEIHVVPPGLPIILSVLWSSSECSSVSASLSMMVSSWHVTCQSFFWSWDEIISPVSVLVFSVGKHLSELTYGCLQHIFHRQGVKINSTSSWTFTWQSLFWSLYEIISPVIYIDYMRLCHQSHTSPYT